MPCYPVYAITDASNDLPSGSSVTGDTDSDSSSNIEIGILPNHDSVRAPEDTNAKTSDPTIPQNFEPIIPWYLDPTIIDRSEITTDIPETVGDYQKPFSIFTPRVIVLRAAWGNEFFRKIRGGPLNAYYINSAFDGWNLAPAGMPNGANININLLIQAVKNSVWATNARVDDTKNETRRAHARLDSLSGTVNGISAETNRAHARLNSLGGTVTGIGGETARAHARLDSLSGTVSKVSSETTRAHARLDSLSGTVSKVSGETTRAHKRLDSLDKKVNGIAGETTRAHRRLDSLAQTVSKGNTDLSKEIHRAHTRLDSLGGTVNHIASETARAHSRLDSFSGSVDRRFADLTAKVNSFNWSDAGIIAALMGVKGSVDEFKEWFRVGDLESFDEVPEDGDFLRMLKKLFRHLEDTTRTYFGVDKDGVVKGSFAKFLEKKIDDHLEVFRCYFTVGADKNKPTGIFTEFLADLFYKLRYSVIEEFDQLKTTFKEIGGNLLGALNTANKLLDLIAKKDFNATVIGQLFDYDRLQRIIDSLHFDSSGGDGWLSTLIKTVGGILKSAIDGGFGLLNTAVSTVGSLLERILDFLDSLLDKIIKLVVPDNLDFMQAKFDDTSKTFKLKFSFVFNWLDSFKGLLGNQEKIKDISIDLGMFKGSVVLPMSRIAEFAPLVKAVITGFILLEFLIDMYKWFHRKGEIVE